MKWSRAPTALAVCVRQQGRDLLRYVCDTVLAPRDKCELHGTDLKYAEATCPRCTAELNGHKCKTPSCNSAPQQDGYCNRCIDQAMHNGVDSNEPETPVTNAPNSEVGNRWFRAIDNKSYVKESHSV